MQVSSVMISRRRVLQSSAAALVLLPATTWPAPLERPGPYWSVIIRDKRFPVSCLRALRARSAGHHMLDVTEDVSGAYLTLLPLMEAGGVGVVAGITTPSAKEVLGTLFRNPSYVLEVDLPAGDDRDGSPVKLVEWQVRRQARSTTRF